MDKYKRLNYFCCSVLMKISDKAMNSRIVRRFVIYDNISEVSVNTEDTGKLFVSSAESRSDYKWQSQVAGMYVSQTRSWHMHRLTL